MITSRSELFAPPPPPVFVESFVQVTTASVGITATIVSRLFQLTSMQCILSRFFLFTFSDLTLSAVTCGAVQNTEATVPDCQCFQNAQTSSHDFYLRQCHLVQNISINSSYS